MSNPRGAKKSRIQKQAGSSKAVARWLLPTFIFLVTILVFLPALQNGFVNWDDGKTLLENPRFRGLGWAQLRWMFTTFYMGHYQPLSWMTFGLDYLVWGIDPFGYHLTSLLLHAVNAVLFYFLALRLLSLAYAIPEASGGLALRVAAGFAALFFAIHPLRVESVAWATERRDVLAGLFLLWTVLLYLRAVRVGDEEAGRWWWLGAAMVVYVLSLLSKATGIALPIVLLVLDVYPLRRLGGGEEKWFGREAGQISWEKIPFLPLALGAGVVALLAQKQAGALVSIEEHGFAARIMQALFGFVFYMWKTVVPTGLSPLYELPSHLKWWSWPFVLSGLVVLGLTLGLFLFRRRWPAGLAIWVCYVAILAPVLGVAQSGPQFVADRYSYLSCLGWAVLAGAGIFYLWRCWVNGKINLQIFVGVAVLSLVMLGGLGVSTWGQTQVWHDSERLWRYALSITEGSSFGHNNLGITLSAQGKSDEAIAHFRRGLQIHPKDADLWYNLGNALARQGKLEESVVCLQQALRLDPQYADADYDLGNVRAAQGKLDDAVVHFREALRIDPAYAKAHNNLGSILAAQGKLDEALAHFREAVRIDPDHAKAHHNLGLLLAQRGELGEAIEHYRAALKLSPGQSEIHFSLANALTRQGNLDEGIKHFEAVLKIRPDFAEAHETLARALTQQGKREEAIQHYQEVLRIMKSGSGGRAKP